MCECVSGIRRGKKVGMSKAKCRKGNRLDKLKFGQRGAKAKEITKHAQFS